jgi:two-component system nitrogen regulation response regulator GlnG
MTSQKMLHNSSSDETNLDLHRVLVVDGEPALCFAYGKLLENERFGFNICEDLETAITLLSKHDYFAVISDIRFAEPDYQDGVYFLSKVRTEQPKAKVILVTGYGSDDLKTTVRQLGASHYFEKPVTPYVILSLLRTLHFTVEEQENMNLSGNSEINWEI